MATSQTEEATDNKPESVESGTVEESGSEKSEPKEPAATETPADETAHKQDAEETQDHKAAEEKADSKGSGTAGESRILELSTESFKAFCTEISTMFSIGMKCDEQDTATVTIEVLQERFKNLVAVTSAKAEGAFEGTFQIILSREGLFTLAGAITMPAQMNSLLENCVGPEKTMKNIQSGSLKEAEEVSDTVAEACNLMIGSWDRVFREGLEGHEHLLQTKTFVGDPWDNPKEKIGLASDEEYLFASHKITISSYPAFDCGVIFPKTIFSKVKVNAENEEKAKAEAEEKAEAVEEKIESTDEQKAESETETKAEATEEKDKPEAEARQETEEKAETKDEAKEKTEAVEEKIEATDEPKTEPEAETKAEATEEKDKPEAEARQETEEKAETKDDAEVKVEAEAEAKTQTEEKTSAPAQSQEPQKGKVSETIQKMTQSPAILPGESGKATIANICVSSEVRATDIMQKEVVWATSEESVEQALKKMQQRDSGYIMIGKDGILEGIVSKSDITGATSIYLRPIFAKWYGPLDDATLQIKLKWIMSRPVRTVRPETQLAIIIENISRFGGRGLPVVDEQGKVQGLITVFDIFRTLLNTSDNVSAVGKTAEAPALV